VKFQSGRAELWIETAEQTKSWLDDDRHADFFFEEPDTEAGSLAGEGEESETDDDPSQPGDDQDDPGSADGRDDGDGRGRSDYDYDEEYPMVMVAVENTIAESRCGLHRQDFLGALGVRGRAL